MWRHVDDFDPANGESTFELVDTDAHDATLRHAGSVAQYGKHHGVPYKRSQRETMVAFEGAAPPLSELDIKRVESHLGVHLPQDLKEHYLLHNGGRPRPSFLVKDGEAYEVRHFNSMNTGAKGASFERTYVMMMVDQTPEFPRGYIPFARDPGGDMFLYSVRPESFGNIMFISHEDHEDPDRYVVFLAPSLKQFINSLTELPEGWQ